MISLKIKDDDIKNFIEEYVSGYDILDEINNRFLNQDKLGNFIDKLALIGNLLPGFIRVEMYLLCSKVEGRYKKEIPFAFKYSKTKTRVYDMFHSRYQIFIF